MYLWVLVGPRLGTLGASFNDVAGHSISNTCITTLEVSHRLRYERRRYPRLLPRDTGRQTRSQRKSLMQRLYVLLTRRERKRVTNPGKRAL